MATSRPSRILDSPAPEDIQRAIVTAQLHDLEAETQRQEDRSRIVRAWQAWKASHGK